uniref:G protein-coupled receptor n=1 Tax=Globodera pallida TaxID=36090 RepID=A0A183C2G6_GLOPA
MHFSFSCTLFTRMYIGICWLCGLIYSLILNFKPHLRAFACVASLTAIYPPAFIQEDDMLFKLIVAVGQINLATTAYTPTAFYGIGLLWMVGTKVWKVYWHANAEHQQSAPPNVPLATDNYSHERIRLYTICILGTMPPFVLTVFMQNCYSNNRSPVDQTMIMTFTILYAIYHIQQPMVMLMLSRELREEMRKGFGKMWKKARLSNGNRAVVAQHTNSIKIAWPKQLDKA